MSSRAVFDIAEYRDTAFCPVHEMLEPFKVIGEPKISVDSRAAFAANNARFVTVAFLCEQAKGQIVTAA